MSELQTYSVSPGSHILLELKDYQWGGQPKLCQVEIHIEKIDDKEVKGMLINACGVAIRNVSLDMTFSKPALLDDSGWQVTLQEVRIPGFRQEVMGTVKSATLHFSRIKPTALTALKAEN